MHTFESKHLGGEQKEDEQKDGLLDLIYSWLTKASDYQVNLTNMITFCNSLVYVETFSEVKTKPVV